MNKRKSVSVEIVRKGADLSTNISTEGWRLQTLSGTKMVAWRHRGKPVAQSRVPDKVMSVVVDAFERVAGESFPARLVNQWADMVIPADQQ